MFHVFQQSLVYVASLVFDAGQVAYRRPLSLFAEIGCLRGGLMIAVTLCIIFVQPGGLKHCAESCVELQNWLVILCAIPYLL